MKMTGEGDIRLPTAISMMGGDEGKEEENPNEPFAIAAIGKEMEHERKHFALIGHTGETEPQSSAVLGLPHASEREHHTPTAPLGIKGKKHAAEV